MSCLRKGTVIQSRRLSEYRCYATLVVKGHRKLDLASVVEEPVSPTDKVCQIIANIDSVFGQMSCIWSVRVHRFRHFKMHVSWTG